jgi:hypothetical protein
MARRRAFAYSADIRQIPPDVLIFVKSMIYIQGQLLTSFRDAKGITLTVKRCPR